MGNWFQDWGQGLVGCLSQARMLEIMLQFLFEGVGRTKKGFRTDCPCKKLHDEADGQLENSFDEKNESKGPQGIEHSTQNKGKRMWHWDGGRTRQSTKLSARAARSQRIRSVCTKGPSSL